MKCAINKAFFASSERMSAYERNVIQIAKYLFEPNDLSNSLSKPITEQKRIIIQKCSEIMIVRPNGEILCNTDILCTLLPGSKFRKKDIIVGLEQNDYSINLKILGREDYVNFGFFGEIITLNELKNPFIINKIMLNQKNVPPLLSAKHTRQYSCDSQIIYNTDGIQYEHYLDIKTGNPLIDNRCTITPLLINTQKKIITGIVNETLPFSKFFDKLQEQWDSLIRLNIKGINSKIKEMNACIYNENLSFTERLEFIQETQLRISSFLKTNNINHTFNPLFYTINEESFSQKPQTTSLAIQKHQDGFYNLASRRRMYKDILQENAPEVVTDIKNFNFKGSAWGEAFLEIIKNGSSL